MAQIKRRTSHKKELYYILCIVSVMVILSLSLLGPRGYQDLRKARLELQAQRARVQSLHDQNDALKMTIDKLKTDPFAMEKYAREKGYGRPDEIIQELPEEAQPSK